MKPSLESCGIRISLQGVPISTVGIAAGEK